MSNTSTTQNNATTQPKHKDPARAEVEGVAAFGRLQTILELLNTATKDGDDVRSETIDNCVQLLRREAETMLWSVAGDGYAPDWIPESVPA